MVTATRVSLEQFLAMEETKPYLELIDGEVVAKPMPGTKHSDLVAELIYQLKGYARTHPNARVETELRHSEVAEERVYLPDVSVTLRERLVGDRPDGPETVHPDLAIEVLSPDDRASRVLERVDFYLRAGVSLVWVIDPDQRSIVAYRQDSHPARHVSPATIDAAPVLGGFELDLSAFFSVLDDVAAK
jgi:Uma2 family endonuclease